MLFYWSNPIILQFIAGMCIARLYITGFRLPYWGSVFLITVAIGVFFLIEYKSRLIFGIDIRRIPCAIIAICLVAAFVLCQRISILKMPKFIKLLGDASYSFYLAHPFFIGAAAVTSGFIGLSAVMHFTLSFLLCVIGSIIAYSVIEKPMMGYFKGRNEKAL